MGLVHYGSARLYHTTLHHVHATQTARSRKLANNELGNGGHVYCPLYLPRYRLASIPQSFHVTDSPLYLGLCPLRPIHELHFHWWMARWLRSYHNTRLGGSSLHNRDWHGPVGMGITAQHIPRRRSARDPLHSCA